MACAVAGCLGWLIASSLFVYPHSLSYYNELAGGPRQGFQYVFDWGFDWGQDLFYLRDWLDKRPETWPVQIAYFGCADPRWAGMKILLPPKLGADQGPQPGWYAVSLRLLRGFECCLPNGAGNVEPVRESDYAYFRHFNPVATAGYSIYIYHVTAEDANRARRELGLPELPAIADYSSSGSSRRVPSAKRKRGQPVVRSSLALRASVGP